jgi:hypothetical protein
MSRRRASALADVRERCLSLPETSERLSHGAPTFFIGEKKSFVMFLEDHHGDGRLALWCAAPEGMQDALVAGEPEHYFVPPYVGHRGWLGVRLDRDLAWNEIAGRHRGRLRDRGTRTPRRRGEARRRRLGIAACGRCAP